MGRIQFHSKMNLLGADIISLILQALKPGGVGDNFYIFVITNDAQNFSVGANLMSASSVDPGNRVDDVDMAIRQFQGMTQAIKFSPKPVVIAPFGLALAEAVRCHSTGACQPTPSSTWGWSRSESACSPAAAVARKCCCARSTVQLPFVPISSRPRRVGRTARGHEESVRNHRHRKVATSANEARGLGFLSNSDRITMNRERVLSDAKARALELVRAGYEPPVMRTDIPAPGENILATLKMGVHIMRQAGYITDHEKKMGTKIAEVLCGGNITPGTPVSEQYVLDLEREAFKSPARRRTRRRSEFSSP